MTQRIPPAKNGVINMADVERWERVCPTCGKATRRHSIDGGLTSNYYGECGHSWQITPTGKEPRHD